MARGILEPCRRIATRGFSAPPRQRPRRGWRPSPARCGVVAAAAGLPFPPNAAADLKVVERVPGGSGTEFGVPSVVSDLDRRPLTANDAARLASLVEAAWSVL